MAAKIAVSPIVETNPIRAYPGDDDASKTDVKCEADIETVKKNQMVNNLTNAYCLCTMIPA